MTGHNRFVLLAIATIVLVAACSAGYVFRAGIEESRILSRRRPIAEVAADPATPENERQKLVLVTQARDFAERVLGLNAGNSYTTYSYVDRDTLLLVVSAARKDRFEPYTWWFPIVGDVPYRGFFDFGGAHALAAGLAAEGYDTYVRPSSAFSTLGWFNDPVLNTVLRAGDVALASTVIHEILHNTLFLSSQVSFNESFASFVGDRGAIVFFCSRDGDASQSCVRARDEWADNILFGGFLSALVEQLEDLYGRTDLDFAAKVAERETLFDNARTRFRTQVVPRLRTRSFRSFAERPLNNATLIGIRLYYRGLDRFEAVFQARNGDLVATIEAITEATRSRPDDPYAALERLITGPGAG